ncbi:Transposase DDE domain-containing protein [Pseudomonas grimontii]|uniref:IS4 family transposase n=1 Tax=Pseudomonas grimontii TaxID=129847 RepID=A0A1H1BN77_9PSED|nr:IS4 family transposase [Pseudomonas grimontii]TWR51622.1 IS4 family transposase [Pseudomonas grimontii]SDQ53397.1 Transposase DDE domain-containing protein [Pseudomonas grimontii]SDQ84756.1 Transposase DDE domain-containing protein [Pseudomonas grimontii]SDQ88175.1 Transposase DDE domain-containing protein [Pseudomonas grimontii]SDQ88978.1 Transposase DDE domain-containing protein [Pseudomonas grimontii]
MTDATQKLNEDWPKLLALLPAGWEAKAKELGALKFGRRFSGPESLLRTLLMYLSADCSMIETVQRARAGDWLELSDVGLLKRVNKSGPWLGWITEQLIQQSPIVEVDCPALQGRRLLAVDGSVVTEPGAVTSTWRLHYTMQISTLRCCEVQVTSTKVGESLAQFTVQPGDVFLADRGFANRRGINHVLNGGGDVLVRMNLSSLPLKDEQGLPFEQLAQLRTLQPGQSGEWPAVMQGSNGNVAVRVCAYRKTEEQRLEGERKLKRTGQKKQKKVQPQTVEAAGYVVVVTTLDCLDAQGILALYRHRWQVELAFKRMKSLLGLSHLRKKNPEGAKAWLQGKLLVACLIERLIATGEHFSPIEGQGSQRASDTPALPLA